jgi:dihydroflavonol-4-reductase
VKAAVTGGTGVVGAALVRHLVQREHEVRALSRSDDGATALERSGARVVRGDVLDSEALDRLVSGAEVVFHVAGVNQLCPPDPGELWKVNVGGTRSVLEAARRAGVSRVVHTSSAVTIGEREGQVGTEDTMRTRPYLSHYERTKAEAERIALGFPGVEVVSVNPSSVQGPGRATGTGRVLLQAARRRLAVIVDSVFSVVDIEDCALGHLLAAERGRAGERYILSGGTLTTREALAMVQDVTGPMRRPLGLKPRTLAFLAPVVAGLAGAAGRQPMLCPEAVRVVAHPHRYDGSRATRDLGLVYRPPAETFKRAVDWFRAEGLL